MKTIADQPSPPPPEPLLVPPWWTYSSWISDWYRYPNREALDGMRRMEDEITKLNCQLYLARVPKEAE